MSKRPVITLKNVTRQYGQTRAVDQVSLSVERGEMLVLLGSSGCGKTTTLRLIAGLERPDEGEIWLDGTLVAGTSTWSPPEARRIGMVFQDYALFPHMSSLDNITFPLRSYTPKQRRERADELLTLVGMQGMGERFPHQLSGGQQQRIALARALAPHPSVVLLDEPFSNLDAFRRKQVREEVREILKAAGATAVFVTHDQEEAMSIADVIAVMQAGHMLQVGKPTDLYRFPALPEVADFLGEVNRLPGTANGTTVQTALGDLALARAVHGHVQAFVRPESILLDESDTPNATVQAVQFHGYYQMVTVRLDDGTRLNARVWAHVDLVAGDPLQARVAEPVVAFHDPNYHDGARP